MARILLVDDCELNRAMLSRRLRRLDCRVIEADNGAAALAAIKARPVELALVDLLMPEVDGFEFVHQLRQLGSKAARTPVVFITSAYLPEQVLQLARSCGVTRVLSKQVSTEELSQAVKDALGSAPPGVTVPPWDKFTLDLLRLFSGTLVRHLKEVIPTLARRLDGGEPQAATEGAAVLEPAGRGGP